MAGVVRDQSSVDNIIQIEDLSIHRWLICDSKKRFKLLSKPQGDGRYKVTLLSAKADGDQLQFESIAWGIFHTSEKWFSAIAPLPNLPGGRMQEDPYECGNLFHGPAFRYLKTLYLSSTGGSAIIDCDAGFVPKKTLYPGLLDSALHFVPNDSLCLWCKDVPVNMAAFPVHIREMQFCSRPPLTGILRGESRYLGMHKNRARIHLQLIQDEKVWMNCILESALVSTAAFGVLDGKARISFLRNKQYTPGVGLSQTLDSGTTSLNCANIKLVDWLPGTVNAVYNLGAKEKNPCQTIAVKEHVARRLKVHPSRIAWVPEDSIAVCHSLDSTKYKLTVTQQGLLVVVEDKQ